MRRPLLLVRPPDGANWKLSAAAAGPVATHGTCCPSVARLTDRATSTSTSSLFRPGWLSARNNAAVYVPCRAPSAAYAPGAVAYATIVRGGGSTMLTLA